MREANEATRTYYEGHLQEMKLQRLQPAAPAPAKLTPEIILPLRK